MTSAVPICGLRRSVHLVQGQSIDLVIGGAIDLGDAQTISLLAPQ